MYSSVIHWERSGRLLAGGAVPAGKTGGARPIEWKGTAVWAQTVRYSAASRAASAMS